VNPVEVKAFNDMTDVVEELLKENAALRAENIELRNTLKNDINSVHEHASRLADHGFGERPELDEGDAQEIDYDWHPGIQVGSPEREDANRIGRLIDEIGSIQRQYAFTGIWGPHEWESIAGGLEGIAACAIAQRRFRPRSESGTVIDVRTVD
jgi:hypothetical protein